MQYIYTVYLLYVKIELMKPIKHRKELREPMGAGLTFGHSQRVKGDMVDQIGFDEGTSGILEGRVMHI